MDIFSKSLLSLQRASEPHNPGRFHWVYIRYLSELMLWPGAWACDFDLILIEGAGITGSMSDSYILNPCCDQSHGPCLCGLHLLSLRQEKARCMQMNLRPIQRRRMLIPAHGRVKGRKAPIIILLLWIVWRFICIQRAFSCLKENKWRSWRQGPWDW